MDGGEILTRVTIWITLAGYTAGTVALVLSRGRPAWDSAARLAWTVACAALAAHVAVAFHVYHGWSHEAAYRETARQTAEVVGVDWGGGVYVNYALLAGWIADVVWWWSRGAGSYRRRPWPLQAAWHGFLIFIFFNATVVFKTGTMRWVGLGMCLVLAAAFWRAVRGGSLRRAERLGSPS